MKMTLIMNKSYSETCAALSKILEKDFTAADLANACRAVASAVEDGAKHRAMNPGTTYSLNPKFPCEYPESLLNRASYQLHRSLWNCGFELEMPPPAIANDADSMRALADYWQLISDKGL